MLKVGNSLTLNYINSTEYTITSSDVFLNKSSFTHILGRVVGNTLDMFVDGSLAGTTTITPFGFGKTMTHNLLGRDISGNNSFDGTIGYLNIWNKYDLTTQEITGLEASGFQPQPEPEPEPEPEPIQEPETETFSEH